MSEVDRILTALASRSLRYRCTENYGQWKAQCPECSVEGALTITEGSTGRVHLSCRSRCDPGLIRHTLERHDWCYHCGSLFGEVERLRAEIAELRALPCR